MSSTKSAPCFVLIDCDLPRLKDFDGFLCGSSCYCYALYFGAKPELCCIYRNDGAPCSCHWLARRAQKMANYCNELSRRTSQRGGSVYVGVKERIWRPVCFPGCLLYGLQHSDVLIPDLSWLKASLSTRKNKAKEKQFKLYCCCCDGKKLIKWSQRSLVR